jgi:hypothetical protein
MICPNCGYTHGHEWVERENEPDEYKEIKGEHGDFFRLSNSIKMERPVRFEAHDTRVPTGCPNCNLIFMSND